MPGITFPVDSVEPAAARLEECDCPLEEILGVALVASSGTVQRLVCSAEHNALAMAVQLAFAQHRPLRLTPDAVWITIAQGFAIHVNENAERLRERFVRHSGKKTLTVETDAWGSAEDWQNVVQDFGQLLRTELGPGLCNLIECSFSTTGSVEKVVSQITLMDTFRKYFDYEVRCICGIPEVVLAGTPEDWRDIRRRMQVMAEYDLQWWADKLLPVCDELVRTAEGKPDLEFWQCMYKPRIVYVADEVTGWLVRLFPYLAMTTGFVRNDMAPWTHPPRLPKSRNTLLGSLGRLVGWGTTSPPRVPPPPVSPWLHEGISLDLFPASLSRALVRKFGVGGEKLFELVGGLVGVSQDEDGLALSPKAAWAVQPALQAALWMRLGDVATLRPARSAQKKVDEVPAKMLDFYEFADGGSFAEGALIIRGLDAIEPVRLGKSRVAYRFADLRDGSSLLYLRDKTEWWVLHARGVGGEAVAVIARSILELFQRLADEDPPYFLAPGYRPRFVFDPQSAE